MALQTLIDRDGLKGMTSNPSIFEKAMGHGTNYDAGFKELAAKGDVDAQTIYETSPSRTSSTRPTCCGRSTRPPTRWTATSRWRCRPIWRCAPTTRSPRRGGCGNGRPRQPDGEGARHRRGHAGDQDADRRGHEHQRHAAVQPAGLQGRGRGVHRRAGGLQGERRRRQPGGQRGELLRQPHRRADRQADRREVAAGGQERRS